MTIRKAVIPAAGMGTRFLPATKAQPKEMLPIVDKPAIQYIVEEAVQSGIESIIVVTGRNKRSIEDHFDRSFELEQTLLIQGKLDVLHQVKGITDMACIHFIRQAEPLGLGHAVSCARQFIGDEPFAVLLGDDIMMSGKGKPALQQLIDVYDAYRTEVIGVQTVPLADVHKYGIIDAPEQNGPLYSVQDLIEKPQPHQAPSRTAVMGRYILQPSIFPILESIERGVGNEIQLTDALRKVCRDHPIQAVELESQRFDIGDKMGYLKASMAIGLQREDTREELLSYLLSLAAEEGDRCPV